MLRRSMFRFGIGDNGANFFEFSEFFSKRNQGEFSSDFLSQSAQEAYEKIRVYEMNEI